MKVEVGKVGDGEDVDIPCIPKLLRSIISLGELN